MRLFRSNPSDFRLLGWRKFAVALLAAWLLPALLAAVALGLQWLLGTQTWGETWLMVWALSVLTLFSPALSWLGLIIAGAVAAILMRLGWLGWIPAVLLGLALGGAFGFLMGNSAIMAFGAVQIALLRALMARACPQAFN